MNNNYNLEKYNNNPDSGSRILYCDKSNSGLFYCAKEEVIEEAPSSEEFSKAIKQWKADKGFKSVKGFGPMLKHDLSKYPIIGDYLSQRTLKVDWQGVPIVENKHERALYQSFSGIPYRHDISIDEDSDKAKAYAALVKEKEKMQGASYSSHPIDKFNLISGHSWYIDIIDYVNSARFRELKKNHSVKYAGLNYSLTEIQPRNIISFLDAIESKYSRHDNCPYNVILRLASWQGHAVFCAIVVDTKDIENPKVKEIIGFNSWPEIELCDDFQDTCPIDQLRNIINEARTGEDRIKVTKITYGAQVNDQKNTIDRDINCMLYAINGMNALAGLLIDSKSLFHQKLLLGYSVGEPTFWDKLDLLKKIALYYILSLAIPALICLVKSIFGDRSWISMFMAWPTLNMSVVTYALILCILLICKPDFFSIHNLLKEEFKEELQRALPQYFYEENGKMYVRPFEQRKYEHIKDKWLLGCAMVEWMMKGKFI